MPLLALAAYELGPGGGVLTDVEEGWRGRGELVEEPAGVGAGAVVEGQCDPPIVPP